MTAGDISSALSLITGAISSVFPAAIWTTFPINLMVGMFVAGLLFALIRKILGLIRGGGKKKRARA